MVTSPLISIIIPTLNQGKFIKQTLDSIISQDYKNIEIIVMDGGSIDGTLAILKKYGKQVTSIPTSPFGLRGASKFQVSRDKIQLRPKTYDPRPTFYWKSEKDKGQADAINKGLRKAKGDIIAYINSDDFYYPAALRTVANYFTHHPEAMWVSGDYRIVDECGNEIQQPIRWYKKIFRMFPLSLVLPILNPIAQPSTFWRKKVVEKIGFFDESLRYVFDYDYWLRIAKIYPLTVLPDVLSGFRIHKESKGGRSYKKQFEEETEVLKRYVHNPVLQFLHRFHNTMIVGVYNVIK